MKKLLILLLSLSLLVTAAFALSSCGKDDADTGTTDGDNNDNTNDTTDGGNTSDEKVDYTVKVVDQNGDAVPGVPVTLEIGPATKVELTTNTSGVATHNMKETSLPIYAVLGTLPEGYGDGDVIEVQFAAGAKTATLEVIKQVAYKVSFVDSDGVGVAGVLAQVCVGDSCLTGKTTGETGVLIFYVNPDSENVSMQINTIPEAYAQTLKGTKQYYESGSFEITVVLEDAV